MIALLLLGCGSEPDTLRVLAASSLQEGFTALGERYSQEHPDIALELVFAGSQTHAAQLRQGLDAELLASADPALIDGLVEAGLAVDPAVFAANQLVLAAPGPISLEALPLAGQVVLGTPSSPIGLYTDRALQAAGAEYGEDWAAAMQGAVRSREPNTRLVLAKVAMGEADAAVVYATDLAAAPELVGTPLPEGLAAAPEYAVARVGSESEAALQFQALLLSDPGQEILQEHGFSPPQ